MDCGAGIDWSGYQFSIVISSQGSSFFLLYYKSDDGWRTDWLKYQEVQLYKKILEHKRYFSNIDNTTEC